MKKLVLALAIVATLAVALFTANQVFAQGTTPPAPGSGYGPMGGRGMMGGRGVNGQVGSGVLHDYMVAAFAEKLGLSVEDLNAQLEAGETMFSIASAEGLTVEEFRTLMLDARSQAVDQALADGVLTQEQADWMKQHGGMMGGAGGRGMRGNRGAYGMGAGCPYAGTPTN